MLSTKTYIKVTKVIFAIVGLVHLSRIFLGWPLVIAGWEVPLWANVLGVLFAGYLVYSGYLLHKKK